MQRAGNAIPNVGVDDLVEKIHRVADDAYSPERSPFKHPQGRYGDDHNQQPESDGNDAPADRVSDRRIQSAHSGYTEDHRRPINLQPVPDNDFPVTPGHD